MKSCMLIGVFHRHNSQHWRGCQTILSLVLVIIIAAGQHPCNAAPHDLASTVGNYFLSDNKHPHICGSSRSYQQLSMYLGTVLLNKLIPDYRDIPYSVFQIVQGENLLISVDLFTVHEINGRELDIE